MSYNVCMNTNEKSYARRFGRRSVEVTCDVICSDWEQPFSHSMKNLSPNGVWLRTSFPREVGETVVLSFRPPHWDASREINVFAQVTRVTETRSSLSGRMTGGMGLAFMDLTSTEKRLIQAGLGHLN